MSKNLWSVVLILGAIVIVAGGLWVYSVLKQPEAASTQLAALPVSTEPSSSSMDQAGQSGATVFQIVPSESEVRFIIDEVLRGSPKTVVGSTDQVAGEIAVSASEPAAAKVGLIQVNARTLTTDNDFRNRAIKNQILDTNDHEFVSFTPQEIVGLPDHVTIGETYNFQIIGDLTVKDITQQVTFDTSLTVESDTRLIGSASTTIRYADFDIEIPQVPSVTGVSDEVVLEIDFVALAQ